MMLEVTALDFDYPECLLLTGVGFTLQPGSVLHVRGANGTGKTTLLKLLAGMMPPMAGKICYQGRSIWDDISAYQQQICYVGHKSGISQSLTVREQCCFDLYAPHQHDISELLLRFDLAEVADMPCGVISSGQRRRTALLRLLWTKAKLWLLDEPLVALDDHGVSQLLSVLLQHVSSGGSVVLTSHQPLALSASVLQEYALC